ncbi:hypothetical protein SAY86_032034 [Trapa natans]|uniref:Transmembrane protein n=1 Tax=Trapa natans TaxID=22666 RepID=A0AAN7LSC6_TRANT|nr:hypothetical protein SAY86_032034 [Trapa natans]
MDHRNSLAESYGGDGSVQPAISDLQRLSEAVGSSGTAPTIFEPRTAGSRRETASTLGILESQDAFILLLQYRPSPEKKLSLFPLRLAVFEKTATGIGALGFIWATVVLLGGFAITLDKTDFCGRTGLQRHMDELGRPPPYGNWLFLSRNVSKLLYWLQILSATVCVVLSLMKLIRHDYGDVAKGDMDKSNRK